MKIYFEDGEDEIVTQTRFTALNEEGNILYCDYE